MLQFSHISTNVKFVLHGLNWKEWLAYLDAVIVHVNSFDNHLCNIRYVLIRSRQHNLKLKQKNGVCSKRCYRFFGQGGQWGLCIRDHGENILCSSMALPTKSERYGYFLGHINCHREHILRNFGSALIRSHKVKANIGIGWSTRL